MAIVLAALTGKIAAGSLVLKAVLTDSAFPPPGPYRVEVLETGDTARITVGEPLSLSVPRDTLWTLCVRRGDSVSAFEKCFEIHGAGKDSAFSARLEGGAVVAEPDTVVLDTARVAAASGPEGGDGGEQAGGAENEAVQLKKIMVRAQRQPKRAIGKQTVSAKLIKRMPGLAEADVLRSIQALPGVVSSSDFSTKIYVRGGGSDQNLILLDNAPVYSPVHFFGLFSTFLVEGIEDVNFYKSGFPPEYGGRLSSVVDIESRLGGKDTADSWFRGSSLKISTIASQTHVEGRQGRLRWLAAGRTTYIKEVLDFLRDQGLLDFSLDYYFYDLQGNLGYSLGPEADVMLSWYHGRDKLNFDPFLVDWGNTILPLNVKWKPKKDWTSTTTLSYSLLSQSFGLTSIFSFYNKIVTIQAKEKLEYEGLDGHRLTFGLEADWMRTVFRNDQTIARVLLRDQSDFWITSAFAEDVWTAGRWQLSPGARLNFISTLGEAGVEPRLTVKYSLPRRQSLDFHVGYYLQYINSILFEDQESLNEFYYPAQKATYQTVHPTSSILFAAGYSKEGIFGLADFSLEGYYKTLDHLLIFAPNQKPDSVRFSTDQKLGDLFDEAMGYSYGAEASLRVNGGVAFGGVSYSHGFSAVQEKTYTSPYFPKWYQPHSLKGDLALNWFGAGGIWRSKAKKIFMRSSLQMKYATGLPYTDYAGYMPSHFMDQNLGRGAGGPNPEFDGNLQIVRGGYNGTLVPSYFRWDVKPVDIGREGKWNFSFTILNVTDQENVYFYTYDRSKNPPERITIPQFPFFPFLLSYEYYF